jgi:hypothetical protein
LALKESYLFLEIVIFYFWGKQRSCNGGGVRSATLGVFMSPKRQVHLAHGCAQPKPTGSVRKDVFLSYGQIILLRYFGCFVKLIFSVVCHGSCFLGYTAENSYHLMAKIISKDALF